MTILYMIAFYLAGAWAARRDERDGDLLSLRSGIVVWLVTAIFFICYLLFAIPGTPAAVTTLFIVIGYHVTASRIISKRRQNAETKEIK